MADPKKSKLIRQLQQVARGPVATIGFGRATESKLPALVLIVSLARNDPELAQAAARAGASAVMLHVEEELPEAGVRFGSPADEREAILQVAGSIGQLPWGIRIGSQRVLASKEVEQLLGLGADFISVSAATAPAAILFFDEVGKIISIGRDLSPYLVRTINSLQVDAVEVSVLEQSQLPGELSILDVMKYTQLVELIRLPLIAHTEGKLTPADVPALREIGVEGLIVDVDTAGTDVRSVEETIRAFRSAIDQAGAPRGRAKPGAVVLPQAQQPAVTEAEEEPEEPDEDW